MASSSSSGSSATEFRTHVQTYLQALETLEQSQNVVSEEKTMQVEKALNRVIDSYKRAKQDGVSFSEEMDNKFQKLIQAHQEFLDVMEPYKPIGEEMGVDGILYQLLTQRGPGNMTEKISAAVMKHEEASEGMGSLLKRWMA